MPYSTRELLARLIKCEAGGEGDNGMKAMSSIITNRSQVPYGEFFRVSEGGNIRKIIEQPGQFTCLKESVGGAYNSQNIYNMDPDETQYEIADWAIAGNHASSVANSLFYYNPFDPTCASFFPPNGTGLIYNRIGQHCFYVPTQKYAQT
ncbi:MAG TPA: cell wall hydrolase [Oscillospiraceae bacterium]|nr:cell wall hydrolase [Oscillospiraceae bacterium]